MQLLGSMSQNISGLARVARLGLVALAQARKYVCCTNAGSRPDRFKTIKSMQKGPGISIKFSLKMTTVLLLPDKFESVTKKSQFWYHIFWATKKAPKSKLVQVTLLCLTGFSCIFSGYVTSDQPVKWFRSSYQVSSARNNFIPSLFGSSIFLVHNWFLALSLLCFICSAGQKDTYPVIRANHK